MDQVPEIEREIKGFYYVGLYFVNGQRLFNQDGYLVKDLALDVGVIEEETNGVQVLCNGKKVRVFSDKRANGYARVFNRGCDNLVVGVVRHFSTHGSCHDLFVVILLNVALRVHDF